MKTLILLIVALAVTFEEAARVGPAWWYAIAAVPLGLAASVQLNHVRGYTPTGKRRNAK